jgi:FMN phosphatase YigB (HAD superfamily)
MIEAVLFDLDETLTDRAASLSKYAALFHREFAGLIGAVSVEEIGSTFVALDERGYRPREEVYAGIAERLRWASAPDISVIRDHWRTWFPASAVARVGLHETLAALAAAGNSLLSRLARIAPLLEEIQGSVSTKPGEDPGPSDGPRVMPGVRRTESGWRGQARLET